MYYDYSLFLQDCKSIKKQVEDSGFNPNSLLCIARGGMSLTHMLSLAWNIRDVYSINAISYSQDKTQHDLVLSHLPKFPSTLERVLILDEIVDTGTSLQIILARMHDSFPNITFKTACLAQRMDACICADFYARKTDEWIDFYWEKDLLS